MVELDRIDIVIDWFAAQFGERKSTPLAPVPSSPPSTDQPGEVSRRLTHDAVERTGRDVVELLTKESDGVIRHREFAPSARRSVVLVDDQVTNGRSLMRAAAEMRRRGHKVEQALVFSVSRKIVGSLDDWFQGVSVVVGEE